MKGRIRVKPKKLNAETVKMTSIDIKMVIESTCKNEKCVEARPEDMRSILDRRHQEVHRACRNSRNRSSSCSEFPLKTEDATNVCPEKEKAIFQMYKQIVEVYNLLKTVPPCEPKEAAIIDNNNKEEKTGPANKVIGKEAKEALAKILNVDPEVISDENSNFSEDKLLEYCVDSIDECHCKFWAKGDVKSATLKELLEHYQHRLQAQQVLPDIAEMTMKQCMMDGLTNMYEKNDKDVKSLCCTHHHSTISNLERKLFDANQLSCNMCRTEAALETGEVRLTRKQAKAFNNRLLKEHTSHGRHDPNRCRLCVSVTQKLRIPQIDCELNTTCV